MDRNTIQMAGIIALLVIIAIMAFFLGKKEWTTTNNTTVVNNWQDVQPIAEKTDGEYEELSIKIIDDVRCGEKCPTDMIVDQLKKLPSMSGATMERKDFADEGVEQYLKDNEITKLPLIVFSTNNFDVSWDPEQPGPNGQVAPKINTFLKEMPGGEYYLEVWSQFNPFQKRSENGFLMLDLEDLKQLKANSYIKGNSEAKITWIEYSDLECPFCAKLHNAGTDTDLAKKYGDDLNIVFNHFPLWFHANAQVWAEIMECLADQKWSDAFYSLMKTAFKDEKSDKDYLLAEAVKIWGDKAKIEKCLEDKTHEQKVKDQMAKGWDLFGITGTPGSILVNNETGEYDIISGAYPTASFEEIIDRLLGKKVEEETKTEEK